MEPRVTLVSWTKDPIETIYALWEASRSNRPFEEILTECGDEIDGPILETFKKVIDSAIPVAENIQFIFMLEHVSVSFREQMVRHRVGAKVGEQIGFDIVPDVGDSTWWSQSMRILDMGQFANEGRYRVPKGLSTEQEEKFHGAMLCAQILYSDLAKAGVPLEEAREIIPLAATHRISWSLNLAALQHIVGKRGCQILQLGLWEPIIRGMIDELATKIHPYFRNLISPPCIKGDKFVGCCFKLDNERRVRHEDPLPPCTLYVGKELGGLDGAVPEDQQDNYKKAAGDYRNLWGRDPFTGEKLAPR